MNWNIITLMPEMIEQGLSHGVVGKAFQKEICTFKTINPRQYTTDVHQTVDDRPFGGGDGMLMMAEPLQRTFDDIESNGPFYYLSPQGTPWRDSHALEMSQLNEVTLLCGRYGGVDQRFLNQNNIQEISIGDYVLSGGELAALVLIDSVTRKIPGVLGHVSSASQDSFSHLLLEAPYFTRPQDWQGQGVPEALLSGDHKKIREFREKSSQLVTLIKRPDLFHLWLEPIQKPWESVKKELLSFVETLPLAEIELLGFKKENLIQQIEEFKI